MDLNFLNLHALISHSSSCLNRDDMNMQKSAHFGGVRRIRISSQCLKRSIRMSQRYRELFSAPSTRTRQDNDIFNHFRRLERFNPYSDGTLRLIIFVSNMANKVVTPWIADEMEHLATIAKSYIDEKNITEEKLMALLENSDESDEKEDSDKKKKGKGKRDLKTIISKD